MFAIAAVIFIIFTLVYALSSAAIIYHLLQYSLPGYHVPHLVIAMHILISLIFWLISLVFLLRIPAF